MPLAALMILNFALGVGAVMASARELRASPRAAHDTLAFRALLVHEVLLPIPIATYLLARATDWTLSYAVDAVRVPSLVLAVLVAAMGMAALGGFAAGASFLRDHRRGVLPVMIALAAIALLAGLVVARHRLGVLGTYAQYRGRFGRRTLAAGGLAGPLTAMLLAWTAAAVHLLRGLMRRP